MAKEIRLTQNKVAIVDDDDFELLNKWKWFASEGGNTAYAKRRMWFTDGRKRIIGMHRLLMGIHFGIEKQIDHINGDGLDNRRCNLRIASKAENVRNKGKLRNNTSGYKGVAWHDRAQKWQAGIKKNNKRIYLGLFHSKRLAALAYNEAALKHHGKFARLNEV